MSIFGTQGGLEKLQIRAFSDARCEQEVTDLAVRVMLNPDSFSMNYGVDFADTQGINNSAANNAYTRIRPERLEFEFMFDRTGAIPNALPMPNGVFDDIEKLKRILVGYNSDGHQPYYLKLAWGRLIVSCKLVNMQVTFKLFRPDGTPIRATARCSFEKFTDVELRVAREDQRSPDVTHQREVPEGTHLPFMAFKIYGDSKHYVEVARANGIVNFRKLRTGAKIIFPPIIKSS